VAWQDAHTVHLADLHEARHLLAAGPLPVRQLSMMTSRMISCGIASASQAALTPDTRASPGPISVRCDCALQLVVTALP
jgi:hypothetical protein